MKEVETVCIVPQQAGSWTKKDNPVHFRWTTLLIFHHRRTKKWCITNPSTHLHGMKAKWKPIINTHQSLKWILDVYKVLGTYACLTVSRLYMWEILYILSNACHTETFPQPYRSLTKGLWQEKKVEMLRALKKERERSGILTLDVDCDTGLLAIGNCFVGGPADDLLTCFDDGRW